MNKIDKLLSERKVIDTRIKAIDRDRLGHWLLERVLSIYANDPVTYLRFFALKIKWAEYRKDLADEHARLTAEIERAIAKDYETFANASSEDTVNSIITALRAESETIAHLGEIPAGEAEQCPPPQYQGWISVLLIIVVIAFIVWVSYSLRWIFN